MKRIFVIFLICSCVLTIDAAAQMPGLRNAPRVGSWRIGLEGGVGVLGGDLTKESQDYHFRPLANVELAFVLHRNIVLGLYGGGGVLRSTAGNMESNAAFLGGGLLIELRAPLFRGSLFPLVQLRGGGILITPELRVDDGSYELDQIRHMTYGVAAGFEAISWRRLGIRVLVGVTYTTTDNLDYLVRGDDNDAYSYAMLSMHYYFGGRR